MTSFFLRVRAWWETADRTQRVVTLFGAALLTALCIATIYFASRPRFSLLYGGLTSAEQGAIVNELTAMGVPYRLAPDGTVMIPAGAVAETRARLAVAGKQPASGHIGYEALDTMGMMVTPKVEQERIKAAIEGELANSVEKIEGVATARVHITLGDQSAFVRQRQAPTASVIIAERRTGAVTLESGRAIARLVQNAVTGLYAGNVSIVSTDGRMLYDGKSEQHGAGIAERKVQAEIAEARRREADLQRKLDLAFGPGNTIASIPILEMNFDERASREIVRTPSEAPLRREEVRETMTGEGGRAPLAPAGVAANMPGAPALAGTPGATAAEPGYDGTQKATEYLANERTLDVREATGEITAMAINVLVNEANVSTTERVDQFLRSYLGPKAGDPAFTFGSTLVGFDTSAQKAAQEAAASGASAARIQQLLSILPIAALLLVGFMVMKALQKAGRSPDVVVAALPGGGTAALSLARGAHGDGRGAHLDPALGGGDAAGDGGRQIVAHHGGPAMVLESGHQRPVTIGAIEERVHVPLEQIRHMAAERPNAVAMLLKGWLLEER
jgi:flagellar M-ring protein FliF